MALVNEVKAEIEHQLEVSNNHLRDMESQLTELNEKIKDLERQRDVFKSNKYLA